MGSAGKGSCIAAGEPWNHVVRSQAPLPTSGDDEKWLAPVQNIQRSSSSLRSGHIDGTAEKPIELLGFSPGGNTTTRTSAVSNGYYDMIDEHDDSDCRLDIAIRVHPARPVESDDETRLIDAIQVADKTTPTFFTTAPDDVVTCMSSVTHVGKLKQQGDASELHVFCSGGHGFGAPQSGRPNDAWPGLCETRMKQQG